MAGVHSRLPVQAAETIRRAVIVVSMAALAACSHSESTPSGRTFATPDEAVHQLSAAVAKGDVGEVVAIFGPGGQALIDTSDPETAQHNREVFTIAVNQGWRFVDDVYGKTLIVGDEGWPFPVPLVQSAGRWRFDAEAGKEEVLVRRIGRNELSAIQICRTYVAAQRLYARHGHDGKRVGLYAQVFSSDTQKHNGLYWPAGHGEPHSPLGQLMTEAADERRTSTAAEKSGPAPFHGYYFRILAGQGASAAGGARSYLVDGEMSGGFALVAWPAHYDVTGIMTFVVNQDGIVHQKDLGSGTDVAVKNLSVYDPDASWTEVE